jgi:oligoribonuclease NrnB/cAMP/cGMP phosphodiesterase (DHH superfamily)
MICFHHIDLDGHCSGALVKLANPHCKLYPINYDIEFPYDRIKENEEVWIVDYSLQDPGAWNKLAKKTKNVTWIDHHISEILNSTGTPAETFKGIRTTTASAALLSWYYIYKHVTPPMIVKYVSDYDTFSWKKKYTKEVESGCSSYNTDPGTSAGLEFWRTLVDNEDTDGKKLLVSLIKDGRIINRYRKQLALDFIPMYGFEAELDGKRLLCFSVPKNISFYDSLREQIDLSGYKYIGIVEYHGNGWTVGVYTDKEDGDASVICKKFGGGGHRQAAGFQAKDLSMLKNIKRIRDINKICKEIK